MREPLTTQEVLEMGKIWGDSVFSVVPPEEVFSHYKPEDVARFYKPKELLSGLPLEEIEAYLRSVKNNQLGSASG